MTKEGADVVVQIMLAVFLGAVLLPIGFNSWFSANQESWNPGTTSLWVVIPVIALIGVVYVLYNKYVK